MNIENQKFEEWRKEQIASLIRMGYPDAAKAFRDLGSVQWAGWQAGWIASRAAIEVELRPPHTDYDYSDSQVGGACEYYEQAKKAIESLGLKVKS